LIQCHSIYLRFRWNLQDFVFIFRSGWGWPCQRRKERIENWSLTDLNPEAAKKFERLERMGEGRIEELEMENE